MKPDPILIVICNPIQAKFRMVQGKAMNWEQYSARPVVKTSIEAFGQNVAWREFQKLPLPEVSMLQCNQLQNTKNILDRIESDKQNSI